MGSLTDGRLARHRPLFSEVVGEAEETGMEYLTSLEASKSFLSRARRESLSIITMPSIKVMKRARDRPKCTRKLDLTVAGVLAVRTF
jgi:hypothetical protein